MRTILFKDSIAWGDAASDDCVAMANALLKKGKKVIISAFTKNTNFKNFVAFENLNIQENDTIIFHSFQNPKIVDCIQNTKAKKILRFHNITPPEFFKFWNINLAQECQKEIDILKKLKTYFDLSICDSYFNQQDLEKLGFKCPIAVLPILMDFRKKRKNIQNKKISDLKNKHFTNILYTGRMAPNKKIEDVLKSFAYYQKYYNKNSRLFLIGGSPCPFYTKMLQQYALHLNIQNLYFTGEKSSADDLLDYYQAADLYLSLSEHEGFCVPLMEAMHYQTPILAYDATAVSETLGCAGVLIPQDKKNPLLIAGIINEILSNNNLKETIIKKQNARFLDFDYAQTQQQFLNILEKQNVC